MARYVRSPVAVAGILAVVLVGACGGSATPSPSSSAPPSPTPASASPVVSPTPAPTASAGSTTTYVVRKGDTLIAIAKRFHITLVALRRANPQVTDPTKLRIGAKLVIPAP